MNKKAFTLIELLIVIAIIGILAVAFGPSLFDGPAKARDAQRIEDLRRIANFINLEYIVPGKSLPADECITPTSALGVVINANLGDFSGKFPQDPSGVATCPDNYAFYSNLPPASKYAAYLLATVEDTSNGNLTYTSTSIIGILNGTASLVDTGDRYILLIQKGT